MENSINIQGEKGKWEIVFFQSDTTSKILVHVENDTVRLPQAGMVELFQTTKQNISLHINNVFSEWELDKDSTVKDYLTVQKDGIPHLSLHQRLMKESICFFKVWNE